MCSFGATWANIWGPLGVAGGLWGGLGRLGGALGGLKLQNTHICEANEGSGDQVYKTEAGARRVQGGCKEGAGRVQGGGEYGSKGKWKSARAPRGHQEEEIKEDIN